MGVRDYVRDRYFAWVPRAERQAIDATPTFSTWGGLTEYLKFNGITYPLNFQQTLQGDKEEIGPGFPSLVSQALMSNTVVFACELARLTAFSETRFQFRRMSSGRPGDLFGTDALSILEHPWTGAVTGDLLTRLLLNADFGGTAFAVRSKRNRFEYNRIRVPRPDWVTVVAGSDRQPDDPMIAVDAEVIGLLYHPGGPAGGAKPEVFHPGEFAIFAAEVPDPLAHWRGIPWVSVAAREIASDNGLTEHKRTFIANGATPNMVVSLDPAILQAEFDSWVDAFKANEPKGSKAYETLYLGGGAKVDVVGRDLQQLDYRAVQGAGETRIAAASGVGAIIAQLSEGMQGSSLNAGNYNAARRRFVDLTIRPRWRNVAGSLESIIEVPAGAELWYDDRDVAFLREDAKDRAEIAQLQAATNRTLTDAGYVPESIVAAILAEDWSLLRHSGLFSVQLQPPGTTAPAPVVAEPPTPKRDALARLIERQPAAPPVHITIADGAFRTETPVTIDNHAAPITLSEGAVRIVSNPPARTVLDYDEAGKVIGSHEEPADG